MKEPYIEGVATHDNPESCTSVCKDACEALTGARTGTAIELRNQESRAPTLLSYTEGHTEEGIYSQPTSGSAHCLIVGICPSPCRERGFNECSAGTSRTTESRGTSAVSHDSAPRSSGHGGGRFDAAASVTA